MEIEKLNPKKTKMRLAYEIVKIYHGEKEAKKAEENFINTFQKKEIPEEMTEVETEGETTLMDILVEAKILSSKGDFRRLVEEGAITNLDASEKITDVNFVPKSGMKFKIGKRRFVKIK
jgi:tyrosyl-tRNA synthetase